VAEHYDALIVGRSLAALLTTALLARRRRRVRLFLPESHAAFLEPWPLALLGLKASPIVRRVLDELGLLHAVRSRLEPSVPRLGVALPDRRFELPRDLPARGVELGRAFPEHRAALLALFDRIEGYGGSLDAIFDGDVPLPPLGFAERRQVRRVLASVPAGQLSREQPPVPPPLMGFLRAIGGLTGLRAPEVDGLTAAHARVVYLWCHGPAPLRGGPDALRRLVEDKAGAAGAVLDARRRAARLEVDGKTVRAVVTADGQRLTAETFVVGDDDAVVGRLCPEAAVPPSPPANVARVPLSRLGPLPASLPELLAWQHGADGATAFVRRDSEVLTVSWPSGPAPDLGSLIGDPAAPDLGALATPVAAPVVARGDPLALWRPGPPTWPRNLVRVGADALPGLGLEGECLTAWHAARRLGGRWQGSPLWPFGRR
jgi:hypothetical protein